MIANLPAAGSQWRRAQLAAHVILPPFAATRNYRGRVICVGTSGLAIIFTAASGTSAPNEGRGRHIERLSDPARDRSDLVERGSVDDPPPPTSARRPMKDRRSG
jgi:hypothetical protein